MSAETAIEWTALPGFRGATWNPVVGCKPVSPGCAHCYAQTMAARIVRMGGPAAARYRLVVKHDEEGKPRPLWNGRFLEVPEALPIPLRTKAPTCYFVNSMSDLFGEGVSDQFIDQVLAVIALSPRHRFQVLTKRPDRMAEYFAAPDLYKRVLHRAGVFRRDRPALNMVAISNPATSPMGWLWLGASVERPEEADRIDHLQRVPAAVRFLSLEPLLAAINLRPQLQQTACDDCTLGVMDSENPHLHGACRCACHPRRPFDWAIVGGESGPGARPMDLAWARSIVAQCNAAGVPAFVKQLGARPVATERVGLGFDPATGGYADEDSIEHPMDLRDRKGGDPSEWPEDLRVRQWPEVSRG